jgi:pimeloyl-ACP methyl ester carboxylesterase
VSSSSTRQSVPEGAAAASGAPGLPTELREGYVEVGEVRLHYVEAGAGPLLVLLHGFPEFWFSWRLQIAPLAAAGFRVVAPDLRGTTCRRGRPASRLTRRTAWRPTCAV